jgi:hypothetical protein
MYLKNFNDEFDILDWKDRNTARMTLERGLQMAANNPTKDNLRPICIELYKLLPDPDDKIICPVCKNPKSKCTCYLPPEY